MMKWLQRDRLSSISGLIEQQQQQQNQQQQQQRKQ